MKTSKKKKSTNAFPAKNSGLTVKAYAGDGSILLAFDLDKKSTKDLAGFAIKRTDKNGNSEFLSNRLNFSTKVDTNTTPEQRVWTTSDKAPFQKFRWVDFPQDVIDNYTYEVTAMYFDAKGDLTAGAKADAVVVENPNLFPKMTIGFTRGYLSSQAYAAQFKNEDIRPQPKSLDYDASSYEKQYEWLGFHARKLIFDFLNDCINDSSCSVDLFAYDLDEPDFIRGLQKLGPRLRAFLDDAPLHTKKGALEPAARQMLELSGGKDNVKTGHFHRFAHDKILIKKDKNGTAVKVLTGSANFSVRGLYVQANNVLTFDDPQTAELYESAFEQSFMDESKFAKSEIAEGWHDLNEQGLPKFGVAFSPHTTAEVSLDRVAKAIQNAKSSVLFAVMELGGSGPVLTQLKNLPSRKNVFSYGMTQTISGIKIYKPGDSNGMIVPFAYLKGKVPVPFQDEFSGGMGQVIHHKFIVVDFNGENPVVFTGSSNLASGGEEANGDNLLAIYDPKVASEYAVEAIRLVDHYHFRAAMKSATQANPLVLHTNKDKKEWWEDYYDPKNIKFHEREVLV